MTWLDHYHAPHPQDWQGRDDAPPHSSFFQVVQPLNLCELPDNPSLSGFALLGFACDEGIRRNFGRVGAVEGPETLRHTLAKLPVHRHEVPIYDAGTIHCYNQDLEAAQAMLSEAVTLLLNMGLTPIIIGGGHELAFGHYQGIAAHLSQSPFEIVNFDAHFDMRPLLADGKGSSGTPFLQIANAAAARNQPFHYHCLGIQPTGNTDALFETAKAHDVHAVHAAEFYDTHSTAVDKAMERILSQAHPLMVSVCLDVFSIAEAPGVSAPQILGLTPWQVLPRLRQLTTSGLAVSYDIAELSPLHDEEFKTARLAAHLVYEIIHHHVFQPGK